MVPHGHIGDLRNNLKSQTSITKSFVLIGKSNLQATHPMPYDTSKINTSRPSNLTKPIGLKGNS